MWVATASPDGVPHLVPLSLAWDGRRILLATPTDSPTVRNARATGTVKLSLDSASDVVLIDGAVDETAFDTADRAVVDTFVERVGWSPDDQDGVWSLLVVTPRTIRVWNGVAEIAGRTVMKRGEWIESGDV